ncbi:WD40-repeat-containing domain protein [Zychaea mexicana]|uniref:WD40-repeat-containing domain protein n=1 Tax=Zychaea mexicana TaxID=64656 RepID=UPI0022FDCC5D|nr:WD40-repeat-containing domain protein [Zychaea mexicana]KAI9493950.1 WD40-repeat-containing domain protein [Zychaea mexicana]
MADNSWVYGIRHQARCLTSVSASTEKSKFLVGTVGVKNNVVCLLEFDEDKSEITPTLLDHPNEIWDIVSCPSDESLFFTCHSPVGADPAEKKATLWKQTSTALEEVTTLDSSGVFKVLWDPAEGASRIIALGHSNVYLSNMKDGKQQSAINVVQKDQDNGGCLQNASWNPHNRESIVTTAGRDLAGWDLRSGKNEFIRKGAHQSTIRAVDCNANKPYHVATGGDDAQVRIWDVRQLAEPLMVVEGHTHWVWSVAFNKFHDQLLLTSGSDTVVNLHNVVSVSSASYLGNLSSSSTSSSSTTSSSNGGSSNNSNKSGSNSKSNHDNDSDQQQEEDNYWNSHKPTDGLICTYDQHEDSVYSVAWSPADTWTFASLSYAGRVVISQVPVTEKFKILGV